MSEIVLAAQFFLWKVFTLAVLVVGFGCVPALLLLFWSFDWVPSRLAIVFIGAPLVVVWAAWLWPAAEKPRCDTCDWSSQAWHKLIEPWGVFSQPKAPPIMRTNLPQQLRRYELLGWNPPKHFYVTLKDVSTHQVFASVYVSKHCNASGQLRKGDEFNIVVQPYTLSNAPYVVHLEFLGLYAAFCGSGQ